MTTRSEIIEVMARGIAGSSPPALYRPEAEAALQALETVGLVVVPREPSREMHLAGLVALVTRIEAISPRPNLTLGQLEGTEDLPDALAAQHYMHLGAVMRTGSEVDAAYRAMVSSSLQQDLGSEEQGSSRDHDPSTTTATPKGAPRTGPRAK